LIDKVKDDVRRPIAAFSKLLPAMMQWIILTQAASR